MSFKNNAFEIQVHLEHGKSGSGASEIDAKEIESQVLAKLEKDMVVTEAYLVNKDAITGSTQVDVGVASDADGFLAAPALTAGAKAGAGALLPYHVQADEDCSIVVAGASTAGKSVVVLRGYKA